MRSFSPTSSLEALPLLDRSYTLVVAGEPYGSFEKYRQIIDSERFAPVRNNLILHDRYIPDKDVKVYFSAADLSVLPYRSATQSGIRIEVTDRNVLDAAARGASEGVFLAINVVAMLVSFIAFVAMFNYIFSLFGTSMEEILGLIFKPLAFLMGVPWEETSQVGTLLGQKTVLNEFIAYDSLAKMNADAATMLSERSTIISIYALCGFSNFGSIAILLGGIGAMIPERRSEIASLGIKALIAGTFACLLTANIAGILI